MTLEELSTQIIGHIRAGQGKLTVEVETPRGYPPVESVEIVERTGSTTAVLLTG